MILFFILFSLNSHADLVSDTQTSILNSLKCEPNQDSNKIIGAFDSLLPKKDALKKAGIVVEQSGEEMDTTITVNFTKPIEFYSAKTSSATQSLGGYFVTSAEFEGDSAVVIKNLKLKQFIDKEQPLDYLSGPIDDKKKNHCVPVMRLKILNKQKFLFGCGWCNG
jgi:hypothetical protein